MIEDGNKTIENLIEDLKGMGITAVFDEGYGCHVASHLKVIGKAKQGKCVINCSPNRYSSKKGEYPRLYYEKYGVKITRIGTTEVHKIEPN